MEERPVVATTPAHAFNVVVTPESPTSPVTLQAIPRNLPVYSITEAEIDQITTVGTSFAVNLTFFGIGLGGAISFFISEKTGHLDANTSILFWAFFGLSLFIALYCGVQSLAGYANQRRRVERLKQRE